MPQSRRRSARRSDKSTSGGLGRVAKATERQKERAAQRDKKWLKLQDGDEIVGRVLDVDDDFRDGYVHRVPFEGEQGKRFYLDVMCLDQDETGVPCPGCKDDLQRRYKFWTNILVRDYEGEGGKAADTVCIWSGGITIAKLLNKKHQRHNLSKRDIVISRTGSTKDDTEYDIDWEDEEDTPLSKADEKLVANKFDLSRYTKIPEFDDFYKHPKDRGDEDDDPGEQSLKRNPFNKKKSRGDEDDEDEQPKRSRRSRSSSTSGTSNRRRRSR